MARHSFFSIVLITLIVFSCVNDTKIPKAEKDNDLISYVNPFIGTGGHGHTYPGATMPFGMMQLSPDTRLDGWDGCSGYHYSDSYIYGFSHTHLSGTGVSDYGDILLMPANEIVFNNGADGKKGYNARYVKIVAKKLGRLPEWHIRHKDDGRSWLFADEITIK